jgi:hypothetical protein
MSYKGIRYEGSIVGGQPVPASTALQKFALPSDTFSAQLSLHTPERSVTSPRLYPTLRLVRKSAFVGPSGTEN